MSLFLSLLVYALLATLFVLVWRQSNTQRSVMTPLFLFGCFEMVSSWPATIYSQVMGLSRTGAYPVVVAGLAFAAMLVGFVTVMAITGCSARLPGAFRDRPPRRSHAELSYLLAIACIAAFLVAIGMYLYQGLPPFAQGLMALSGGGTDAAIDIIAAGREEVTKSHYLGGAYRGQGVILQLMQDGWPYLLVVSILLARSTGRRAWLAVSIVLSGLLLFFIAGSGQRWQVLAAFIAVGVTLSLTMRFHRTWVIGTGLALLVIYIGMSTLNSNYQAIEKLDNPVEEFGATASERIFLGNGMHNIEGINFVADGSLKYGMGTIHLQKILASVPGVAKDDVPFSAKLAVLEDPFRPESDSTYASQSYVGWLYNDLGLPGTVAVYFFIGIVLAVVQAWVFSRSLEIVDLPAVGLVTFYYGELALDGPPTGSATLITVIALWFLLRMSVEVWDLLVSRRHRLTSGARTPAAMSRALTYRFEGG